MNAILRWLNNVSGVYLVQVPCFLLVSRVWEISSGMGSGFPWLNDCANFTPLPEENDQPLLVQYKQQANPHISMHNYTPTGISGNDKNKQLTLLSQRKLALTEKICTWLCKFGGTLRVKHQARRRFFRPRSDLCHQKLYTAP